MSLKDNYQKVTLEEEFVIMKGWYALFRPVKVPYEKLKAAAKMQKPGMIECAPAFGRGWIGVPKPKDYKGALETRKVTGDFIVYEVQGPYKNMGPAYAKVMKDYPKAKKFYNLYVNDPNKVEEKDYITQILFQV